MTDVSVEALCERALAGSNRAQHFGPQAPDHVLEAERLLGVSFPSDYRQFVTLLGSLVIGPYEIKGVTPDHTDPRPPGVIGATVSARQSWPLAERYLPIYFDGGVDYYVLDSRLESPAVEIWRPGGTRDGDVLEVAHVSFAAFLHWVLISAGA
ncbi:MAG: SMI1/KNR4 family protein [Actinomycetota bacterium]